jgi:hypothetical protein
LSAAGRTSTAVIQPCLFDVGERAPGRHPDDFYATPPWCTDAILPHLPTGGVILEPSCGDGAILARLAASAAPSRLHLVGVELHPGRAEQARGRVLGAYIMEGDFLTRGEEIAALYPDLCLIIGNPPFSLAMSFVEAALRLAAPTRATVAMLLRLAFLESIERQAFHAVHAADLYPLAKRPSFTGEGTDSAAYAWWVWGPGRGGRWFPPLLPGGSS